MSTSIKVMAYNTHLFGSVVGILSGDNWKDSQRFAALTDCIKNASVCGADIIALEEFWSSDFIEDIKKDTTLCDLYPYQYSKISHSYITEGPSNPSGLILLTNKRVVLDKDNAIYFDYISEIGSSKFDYQDKFTGKGFYKVPARIDGTIDIILLITHMPTNSGSYTKGVEQCFQYLAKVVPGGDSPVLLLGDFNIAETSEPLSNGKDRYKIWIGSDGILGKTGLVDAYRKLFPDSQASPGFSVVGATNTLWRHFNREKADNKDYDAKRIDYMLYRELTPTSLGVQGTPPPPPSQTPDYSDSKNKWVWMDNGTKLRDISDHYPIVGTFSI